MQTTHNKQVHDLCWQNYIVFGVAYVGLHIIVRYAKQKYHW